MELTEEQLTAAAQILSERLSRQNEEEPDWIRDIRKIASEGDSKTAEAVRKQIMDEISPYMVTLVKNGAMSTLLAGLSDEEAQIMRDAVKDRYEKSPESVFAAANDDLTRGMLQDAVRYRASQAKKTEEKKEPVQEEIDGQAKMDEKAGILKHYLEKAGISKKDEEIVAIASREVGV